MIRSANSDILSVGVSGMLDFDSEKIISEPSTYEKVDLYEVADYKTSKTNNTYILDYFITNDIIDYMEEYYNTFLRACDNLPSFLGSYEAESSLFVRIRNDGEIDTPEPTTHFTHNVVKDDKKIDFSSYTNNAEKFFILMSLLFVLFLLSRTKTNTKKNIVVVEPPMDTLSTKV